MDLKDWPQDLNGLVQDYWYADTVYQHCAFYDTPEGSCWANADGTLHPRENRRAKINPVFEGDPDIRNVRALIERFRMLTGDLPRVAVIIRITGNMNRYIGYNVIFRSDPYFLFRSEP